MAHRISLVSLICVLFLVACGQEMTAQPTPDTVTPGMEPPAAPAPAPVDPAALGGEDNPIRMFFVPSAEAATVLESGEQIAQALNERTGLFFITAVPTNYTAVIEALGAGQADVAWLATFAYILANEAHGVEVALTTLRQGEATYRGQFIARADSGITDVTGCDGARMAYVDPVSTSGGIFPSAVFAQEGIQPSDEVYAGGHPQVVLAIYEGNADCGATYWSPEGPDGQIRDGRATILETYPDVAEVIQIIGFTEEIPNDTVSFRPGFPADLRQIMVDALLDYADSPEGQAILTDLYNITGFQVAQNADYDVVRESLQALGVDAGEFLR